MSAPKETTPKRTEPAEGAPWDVPFGEVPFAFVDLEMTGLDSANDRVIEVCIERVRGEVVEARFTSLVHPGQVSNLGTAIHGISANDLADAVPFHSLAPAILDILDGAIFVAHAAKWDVAFLESEMRRAQVPFVVPHFLDTLALSRKVFATPSHALPALAAFLALPVGRLHRAEEDVRILREVFLRCVSELTPRTARDLWIASRSRAAIPPEILNTCRKAMAGKTPVCIAYRARGKAKEDFLFVVTEVLEDTVKGYESVSRGRRELALSRVLSARFGSAEEP